MVPIKQASETPYLHISFFASHFCQLCKTDSYATTNLYYKEL